MSAIDGHAGILLVAPDRQRCLLADETIDLAGAITAGREQALDLSDHSVRNGAAGFTRDGGQQQTFGTLLQRHRCERRNVRGQLGGPRLGVGQLLR